MEELEAMYLEEYIDNDPGRFFEQPNPEYRYKAITITAVPGAARGAELIETELEADSLVGFMASPSPVDPNAQPLPRLQLISIEIGEYYRVRIDSQIFNGLLRAASISADGLWLLVQDRGVSTRRAGRRRHLCTKVIYTGSNEDYEMFTSLLRRFKDHIPSPLLLGYIYCLNTTELYVGNHIYYEIEREIGYYRDIYSSDSSPSRLDLNDLSRFISRINGHLDLLSCYLGATNDSIRLLSELEGQAHAASLEEVASDPFKQKMHSTTLRLSQAFPVVRSRLLVRETRIQRYKQRGVELSNLVRLQSILTLFETYASIILFVLLTHEDALKGADMAKLGAEIAAASKRDSASMKTVAVLTMAFLPATFFAALFAIPSLDWKGAAEAEGSVIQSNFWVYWAFTVPATVLVFIVWLVLNNRTWLVEVYKERVSGKRGTWKRKRKSNSSANGDDVAGYVGDDNETRTQ
ncbi:hypothetical protein PG984_006169 [Apiospora sp. TS-2023a]